MTLLSLLSNIQFANVSFLCNKTSHKWLSSLIPVIAEKRPGNAQFCVVFLNKPSNRHLSLGGAQ